MAAGLFKRRSTAASSDLQKLSKTESALAQSSFNIEKITDIQSRFTGGEVLLVPGRVFIREGVLVKICRKGPKKRQFFLFNDVLIYGSMTVLAECQYMPQVEIQVATDDSGEDSELKAENAFQINHADKSFHVFALNKADKLNWITNLTKQINKLNTETGSVVYKAVWVPDSASKQCMVCKQKFSAFIRKHHCRMCGRVVCSQCSPDKADIGQLSGGTPIGKQERVCKQCKKPVITVTDSYRMDSNVKDTSVIAKEETSQKVSKEEKVEHKVDEDEDEDSTETEDSDDSEKEEIPVPPPRRKKQLKQLEAMQDTPPIKADTPPSQTKAGAVKQAPPPRPAPPKIASPTNSLKKGPPPRPTAPRVSSKSEEEMTISLKENIEKEEEKKEEIPIPTKRSPSKATTDKSTTPVPAPRQHGKPKTEIESEPRPVAVKRTKKIPNSATDESAIETLAAPTQATPTETPGVEINRDTNSQEGDSQQDIVTQPTVDVDITEHDSRQDEIVPPAITEETDSMISNSTSESSLLEPQLEEKTLTPPTETRKVVQRKKKIVSDSNEESKKRDSQDSSPPGGRSPSINVRPRKSKFTTSND